MTPFLDLAAWPPWLLASLALGTLGLVLAGLLGGQIRLRVYAERDAARARADLLPLAQALRQSIEAVVVTDPQRRITWVNEAFERITGWTFAEARGRKPGELLQFEGTDPATVAAMRAALDGGRSFSGEVLNRDRRGQPYWLSLQIDPLRDAAGRLTGFVSIQSDITERKRGEQALRDAAARLDRTERIAGVGGWDYELATGRLVCTAQVARLLGLPEGAPVGLRTALRCLPRADRRQLQAVVAYSLETGRSQGVDLPVITGQGEPRWMRVTVAAGAAAPDSISGSLLDVTQRHTLKAQLARSADLLRAAFESVDEAFALYDPDDRLVFCNDRYRDFYAASNPAIVAGARFEDIVRFGAEHGQFAAANGRVEEWVEQRLAAHRQCSGTLVQQLSDGRILRVIDRKTPDGHTVGFRVDITELVRATESAERADRAKTEFIATISHELRTPLQVITGFSDLGRHFAAGHAQFQPMFEDIHAAGQRMLRLVNGLLDVSKIDGTVGSLALRRHALAPLAEGVARELAQLAQERGLRFECALPAALAGDVDSFRLQQVLRNVMANALRFAPAGSAIAVEGRELGLGGVEITVRDRGPGVPADELESIFEPFVQSSRTRDGAGGTGLGLAISRRIMGAHGGRITAENAIDGGALIRLWLPPPAPLPAPADDTAPHKPRLLRRPRGNDSEPTDRRETDPCHAPS